MNNYRLSTSKIKLNLLTSKEVEKLLSSVSLIKYSPDGRVLYLTTNKILHRQTSCVYEIINNNNGLSL